MPRRYQPIYLLVLPLLCISAAYAQFPKNPKALISFTYDDGHLTDYTTAYPILSTRGLTATTYVVTGNIGAPEHMDLSQILELQAAGWEIGSHSKSHFFLTTLNAAQLTSEVKGSKDVLESFGINVYTFCYPSSYYNKAVINEVMKYYLGAVGQFFFTEELTPAESRQYVLYRYQGSNDFAEMKKVIDKAICDKEWLIITNHGLANMNPCSHEAVADYVRQKIDAGELINVNVCEGLTYYANRSAQDSNQIFYVKTDEPVILDFRKNVLTPMQMTVTGVAVTNLAANSSLEEVDLQKPALAQGWNKYVDYSRVTAESVGISAVDGNYVGKVITDVPKQIGAYQMMTSGIVQGGSYICSGSIYVKNIQSGYVILYTYAHYTDGSTNGRQIFRNSSTAQVNQWEKLETEIFILEPFKIADYIKICFYTNHDFVGEFYFDAVQFQIYTTRTSYASMLPYGSPPTDGTIIVPHRTIYGEGTQPTTNPVITIDGNSYSYNGLLGDEDSVTFDINVPDSNSLIQLYPVIGGSGYAKLIFNGPRTLAASDCMVAKTSSNSYTINPVFAGPRVTFCRQADVELRLGLLYEVLDGVNANIGQLAVEPNSNSVGIVVDTWNTSGNYRKKWIESGAGVVATTYTVSDLEPNTFHTVKIEGIVEPQIAGPDCNDGVCLSDDSGQIIFSIPQQYLINRIQDSNIAFNLHDLNNDELIDLSDLQIFALHWLELNCAEPDWCSSTDFNHNGTVDFADYAVFANDWLTQWSSSWSIPIEIDEQSF